MKSEVKTRAVPLSREVVQLAGVVALATSLGTLVAAQGGSSGIPPLAATPRWAPPRIRGAVSADGGRPPEACSAPGHQRDPAIRRRSTAGTWPRLVPRAPPSRGAAVPAPSRVGRRSHDEFPPPQFTSTRDRLWPGSIHTGSHDPAGPGGPLGFARRGRRAAPGHCWKGAGGAFGASRRWGAGRNADEERAPVGTGRSTSWNHPGVSRRVFPSRRRARNWPLGGRQPSSNGRLSRDCA